MSDPNVYERTRVVRAEDLDHLGHVNNVVWLRFVVELAEAHARASGSSEIVREARGVWIVRRHELDYHGNARLGDELTEQTWLESMKGARSVRAARFTSAGAVLVEAHTQWAFVDAGSFRPRRIPRALVDAFAAPRSV